MQDNDIWNLFAETGDIEYYLIYKSETRGKTEVEHTVLEP